MDRFQVFENGLEEDYRKLKSRRRKYLRREKELRGIKTG